jgi:hypothetical protein
VHGIMFGSYLLLGSLLSIMIDDERFAGKVLRAYRSSVRLLSICEVAAAGPPAKPLAWKHEVHRVVYPISIKAVASFRSHRNTNVRKSGRSVVARTVSAVAFGAVTTTPASGRHGAPLSRALATCRWEMIGVTLPRETSSLRMCILSDTDNSRGISHDV